MGEPDELEATLRRYGGLEGLARRIGQGDPLAYRFEPAANDDAPPTWSARFQTWLRRLVATGRRELRQTSDAHPNAEPNSPVPRHTLEAQRRMAPWRPIRPMQNPKWRDHWIFKVITAMAFGYAGISFIVYWWEPTWYGVLVVICGFFLLAMGLEQLYSLVRKVLKA